MQQITNHKRLGWLLLGVLIGIVLSAVLPARPLHAVATDSQDGFSLATGMIDNNLEGVYFLDYLTGTLKGAVISLSNGKFTTSYESNVLKDFQIEGGGRNPKFLLVTGLAALRRGPSQLQPGQSLIYVMELNSGICCAYAVPWTPGRTTTATPAPQNSTFVLCDKFPFRNVAVRQ